MLLALIVLAAACSRGARPGDPTPVASEGMEVSVENETANNLRIFVVASQQEALLGRVPALSRRSFRLPAGLSGGTTRLVARPGAGAERHRRHASEPFVVEPAQRLTWRLQASPAVSDVPRLSTIELERAH